MWWECSAKHFINNLRDEYIVKCTDKDVNEDWLSFLDFRDFDAYKMTR